MSHFSSPATCLPILPLHHFTALCYTYAIHSTDRVGIRPSLSVKVGVKSYFTKTSSPNSRTNFGSANV